MNSHASTAFIKYKSYLIPVDVREEIEVITLPASIVQSNSADLNLVIESGEPGTTVWFEFSQSSQPVCASVAPQNAALLQNGTGQSYSMSQAALTPATEYYYRACAIDDIGERSEGAIVSFRTTNAPTVVSTLDASFVSVISALLNGRIDSGTNITSWFVHSTASNIQCGTPNGQAIGNGNSGSSRSLQLNSLSPDTLYYYRFCGLGVDGVNSGARNSFRTRAATVVTTSSASRVLQRAATLNGTITSGFRVTSWFVYGTSGSPQCGAPANTSESNGETGLERSFRLSELEPNTNYFFRMCALGQDGTKSGEVLPFTTQPDPTALSFHSSSGRTDSGITFTFNLDSGQNVNTWYVLAEAPRVPTCQATTRYGEKVLQAGQSSTHEFSGLSDWKLHYARFCSEGVDGAVESIATSFITKRTFGKDYTVNCSDTHVYSSQNGPMRFIVRVPNSSFPERFGATFEIHNDSDNSFTAQVRTRGGFLSFDVPVGEYDSKPLLTTPLSPFEGIYTSFYLLRIPNSDPWRATVGCLTERIFDKQADLEDSQ